MSFRTKLLGLVDVLLRVPPLFIMDELLRIGLGFPQGDSNRFNSLSEADDAEARIIEEALPPIISTYLEYRTYVYKVFVITVLKYVLSCLGKLSSPV
jgi:E3 ubiquitin-protein ligase RNF139